MTSCTTSNTNTDTDTTTTKTDDNDPSTMTSKRRTTFSLFRGWDDAMGGGESTRDILKQKEVLLQPKEEEEESVGIEVQMEDSSHQQDDDDNDNSSPNGFWSHMASLVGFEAEEPSSADDDSQTNDKSMDSLLETARNFANKTDGNNSDGGATSKVQLNVSLQDVKTQLQPVMEQLQAKFSDLPLDQLAPGSFLYYLETEDQRKTPSWKRRRHRFCPGLSELDTIHQWHEALYLAELSYVDSLEELQEGLNRFTTFASMKQHGNNNDDGEKNQHPPKPFYELIYATVEGEPSQPAHFLALSRDGETKDNASSFSSFSGFFSKKTKRQSETLQILWVVRGTKELADVVSDALLEATEYHGVGLAHDGIQKSGQWLIDTHLPLLQHLLEESGRKRLEVSFIGHSLGAGAAAIACMELNRRQVHNIKATCLAFCCPALLDKQLSEQVKDQITTIVADSDCVPRMSGGTVYNLILKVLEHDYKDCAMDDITSLLDVLTLKVPAIMTPKRRQDALEFVKSKLEKDVKPLHGLTRHEIELFPPGKCYHLYRDGVSLSFVEVSCDFFNEIDVSATMVEDHYIHTGCHAMFLELMRKHLGNSKFDFPNDLMAVRQEKDRMVVNNNKEEQEK